MAFKRSSQSLHSKSQIFRLSVGNVEDSKRTSKTHVFRFNEGNNEDNKCRRKNQQFRFNEKNFEETKRAQPRDYGIMPYFISKTPYPQTCEPVKAKELKRRLKAVLDFSKSAKSASSSSTIDSSSASVFDFDIEPAEPTDPTNLSKKEKEKRHLDFIKKRKILTKSEFLVTRLKFLSGQIHPPGPSIGNNWRIDEKPDSLDTSVLLSNLNDDNWSLNETALHILLQQTVSKHSTI